MRQERVDSSWKNITQKSLFSVVGCLPKELCDEVRNDRSSHNQDRHEAYVGWNAKYFTSVIDLSDPLTEQLNHYLLPVWMQAIEYYNVKIDVYEPYEIKKYVKGDSISEHVDQFYRLKPKERKLTMIAQLSDSEEYEGGEVTIAPSQVLDKTIGTVIVFPAFNLHGVKEIVSGNRWSLNCWGWGKHWE